MQYNLSAFQPYALIADFRTGDAYYLRKIYFLINKFAG